MNRLLVFLFIVCTGCATDSRLESRLNPDVSMSGMQTFRILPNHFNPPRAPASVAAAKREIERAIQDTLGEKGYRRLITGKAQADFEVEYVMYVSERLQEGVHDRYLFGDRLHLLGGAESRIDNPIREGNLHIHLLRDGKPFYEAIASDVIGTGVPVDKRIRRIVPRMLDDVPSVEVP